MVSKNKLLIMIAVIFTLIVMGYLYLSLSKQLFGFTASSGHSYSVYGVGPQFGAHPSSLKSYSYANDLGLTINREGIYFIWDWIDKERNGGYSFKNVTAPPNPGVTTSKNKINYDNERERLAYGNSLSMINNVCPYMSKATRSNELKITEEEAYRKFVEKLVERYDGDDDFGCTQNIPDCYTKGDKEYPSQSFIAYYNFNPIRFWQVCNQLMDSCSVNCTESYAKKYAKVQELTYRGVKASCPRCLVLIGGDSKFEEYPPVFEALDGKYVDIIDKHFFGKADDYTKIQVEMDYLKDNLIDANFDIDSLRFWSTEIGTYSGAPIETGPKKLPYQSEREQAEGLIKFIAVAVGEGNEKILWAWGIEEGFGCDCCIFDYTGLVYDGNKEPQSCDSLDMYDKGAGVKKLSYYSYKLLNEKIGFYDSIETIEDSGNYVYKFSFEDKIVYLAWNDNGGSITLTDLKSKSIIITEGIPNAESGAELEQKEYPQFFTTTKVKTNKGSSTVVLTKTPVFIEISLEK